MDKKLQLAIENKKLLLLAVGKKLLLVIADKQPSLVKVELLLPTIDKKLSSLAED